MNTTQTTDFPTEYLALALIIIILAFTLFGGLASGLRARLEQVASPTTERSSR